MIDFTHMSSKKRKEFREWLMELQNGRCYYCKCCMEVLKPEQGSKIPSHMATFEHLVDDWDSPGGKSNNIEDIVLACFQCNTERGNTKQDMHIARLKATFKSKKEFRRFMSTQKISARTIKSRLEKFEQAGA